MQVITRRVVLWCVGGAILVVLGLNAATWIERLQMSADSADTLVNREAKRVQEVMSKAAPSTRGQKPASPDEQAQQGWERIAAEFEQAGLAPEETASMTSAVKDQLGLNPMAQEAYFVPRYVRRGWVKGKETWLFAFGWGMRKFVGGRSEGAGHYLVMALQAEPPHRVLGASQCN